MADHFEIYALSKILKKIKVRIFLLFYLIYNVSLLKIRLWNIFFICKTVLQSVQVNFKGKIKFAIYCHSIFCPSFPAFFLGQISPKHSFLKILNTMLKILIGLSIVVLFKNNSFYSLWLTWTCASQTVNPVLLTH